MKKFHIAVIVILVLSVGVMIYQINKRNAAGEDEIGNSDWSFTINSDYEVWHVNSETIVLGKLRSPNSMHIVIKSYVSAFCYNEDYIVVERLPEGKGSEIREYYWIEVKNDELHGPYEEKTEVETQSLGDLSDWIITTHSPEGSTFP